MGGGRCEGETRTSQAAAPLNARDYTTHNAMAEAPNPKVTLRSTWAADAADSHDRITVVW